MTSTWTFDAAREIYDRLDKITAEAGYAGQVEQDAEAERYEFMTIVAGIIENHFRGLKGPQCTCHQPTRFGYCPVHERDR